MDPPVVLDVGVGLAQAVLEEEGTVGGGERGDAAVEERVVGRVVGDAAAHPVERPETARVAVGEVVELLPPRVDARLDRVAAGEDPLQVGHHLVVALIAQDGEAAGVADDRARDRRAGEADDRRVVAGGDVDVGVAKTKAVAQLADQRRREDLRPGDAEVLLPVVLPRLLADDDVVGAALLVGVLVAGGQAVLAELPVDASRVVLVRPVEADDGGVGTGAARIVRRRRRRVAVDDRLHPGAVRRRVVAARQPRRALAGQQEVAGVVLLAVELGAIALMKPNSRFCRIGKPRVPPN